MDFAKQGFTFKNQIRVNRGFKSVLCSLFLLLFSCSGDNDSSSTTINVLVFTKTAGFDHNTRSQNTTMMNGIASTLKFTLVYDNSGNEFNSAENLATFDIIYFNNTSGDMLSLEQRTNVEAYAAQRGKFISNHAASDAYGHSTASTVNGNGKGSWDWYAENVTGCSVRNNPSHTAANFEANVTINNPNTAMTNGINFPWTDNEEWYYWEGGYINSNFIELLQVSETGENNYDVARMTAHFWSRPDGGKSFYTSMGHAPSKYADPDFIQLMTNAFAYMLSE